MLMRCATASV